MKTNKINFLLAIVMLGAMVLPLFTCQAAGISETTNLSDASSSTAETTESQTEDPTETESQTTDQTETTESQTTDQTETTESQTSDQTESQTTDPTDTNITTEYLNTSSFATSESPSTSSDPPNTSTTLLPWTTTVLPTLAPLGAEDGPKISTFAIVSISILVSFAAILTTLYFMRKYCMRKRRNDQRRLLRGSFSSEGFFYGDGSGSAYSDRIHDRI